MQIRIAIVIARLNRGGTSKYISTLYEELIKVGYDVSVFAGRTQGDEEEDECVNTINLTRIECLGRKIDPVADFQARKNLMKAINKFQPHIVYSHTFKAGFLSRSLRKKGAKFVHCFHGHLFDDPEFTSWQKLILNIAEKCLTLRTDFTISTGEKVRTDLLSLHIGRESKFKSISPGISPLELVPREIGLKTLGLDENETRPIVVWNARMVDVKSPESVLDLAKMFPETLFVMSGGGKRFDFIKNSNKFSNLKVVGWQDPEVINSVADVAISTSRNEGIPISLIESQLSGIPVVAMRVGSIEEIIENGKTGFVCDYFVGDFTESLKKLIESQSLRVQMGVQAKINAQDKFSKIKLALEHVSVFESLEVNPRGIS